MNSRGLSVSEPLVAHSSSHHEITLRPSSPSLPEQRYAQKTKSGVQIKTISNMQRTRKDFCGRSWRSARQRKRNGNNMQITRIHKLETHRSLNTGNARSVRKLLTKGRNYSLSLQIRNQRYRSALGNPQTFDLGVDTLKGVGAAECRSIRANNGKWLESF